MEPRLKLTLATERSCLLQQLDKNILSQILGIRDVHTFDVAAQWRPHTGHPVNGVPYSLPVVEQGAGEEKARSLIEEWLATGVTGGEAEFARRTLTAT